MYCRISWGELLRDNELTFRFRPFCSSLSLERLIKQETTFHLDLIETRYFSISKRSGLTGKLEHGSYGFLPPLGILRDDGQLHQAQDEDELASSQSNGGNEVTSTHHVKLH